MTEETKKDVTKVNENKDENKDEKAVMNEDEIIEGSAEIEKIEGAHKIDVAELLKKVRQEEKTKLYKDIEKMKEKIKMLSDELNQNKELLAKKSNEKLSEQELLLAQQNELKKEILALRTTMEENQRISQEKIREAELNVYRQKRISEANGKIIPELVVGNSEEEINDNYIKAVQYYMQIKDNIINEIKSDKKSVELPTTAVSPRPTINKLTIEDIKRMGTKEWAKNREEILSSVG